MQCCGGCQHVNNTVISWLKLSCHVPSKHSPEIMAMKCSLGGVMEALLAFNAALYLAGRTLICMYTDINSPALAIEVHSTFEIETKYSPSI